MLKEIFIKMAAPLTLICFMTIISLFPLYLTMSIISRQVTEKTNIYPK